MANENDGFNGTTVTFASNAIGTGITACRYTAGGAMSDTTHSTSTTRTFEAGLNDYEVTVDFVGSDANLPAKGDKGALVVTWKDGTTVGSIAAALCTAMNIGGAMDGAVTGSCTFKSSPVDAV